jgi:hypothetical protein
MTVGGFLIFFLEKMEEIEGGLNACVFLHDGLDCQIETLPICDDRSIPTTQLSKLERWIKNAYAISLTLKFMTSHVDGKK